MRIKSLYCKSSFFEWEIKEIDFSNAKTTLLVGISGVGKTQILNAIATIQNIVNGTTVNSFEWKVKFNIEEKNYLWEGAFQELTPAGDTVRVVKNKSYPIGIQYEKLWIEEDLIVDRNKDKSTFNGRELPKLLSSRSIINMLGEEVLIQPIVESFQKLVMYDNTNLTFLSIQESITSDSMRNRFSTLENLMNFKASTSFKLALCFFHYKDTFEEIVADFKDVFPQVEDVRFMLQSFGEEGEQRDYFLQFKEKRVDKWIDSQSISAGMRKTLLFIADLYLVPQNSILLIDEFENSLGVNCIDVLAENLIFERDDVQVILTSHHPYIINKIPIEYWKVVTRKGGVIQTYDAKAFDLGRSHHEHFLSLLNLPEYKTGIPSSAL